MFVTTGMSMEWLGLGINPASYDNGYDNNKDRQNFFALLFFTFPDKGYWKLGEHVAEAWSVGKRYSP